MPFFGLPVPDGWRLNYPHFIGPPKRLRCCFALIAILSIAVFIFSLGYYYEIDKEQIIEISFFAKSDSGWKCESIGTYNGEYTFADDSSIPHNLSINTSIAFIGFTTLSQDGPHYPQQTTIETNTTTINIIAYRINSYNLFGDPQQYQTEVTWGAAPTIDQCIDMMNKYSCSETSVPATQMIENVDVYRFSMNETIYNNIYKYSDGPDLHNSSTNEVLKFYTSLDFKTNEFFSAVVSDIDGSNLCNIIDDGIDNGVLYWSDSSDINCELINDDYCIVNATKQFTFTEDNPLPTNTRMRRVDDSYSNNWQLLYLLLSPELGKDCEQRWQSVCNTYYNINGYCKTVYSPPYSCTKLQNKSLWTVLSLSFASSELVFTILLLFIGCSFRTFSNPVHENKKEMMEDKTMTEMAITMDDSP